MLQLFYYSMNYIKDDLFTCIPSSKISKTYLLSLKCNFKKISLGFSLFIMMLNTGNRLLSSFLLTIASYLSLPDSDSPTDTNYKYYILY